MQSLCAKRTHVMLPYYNYHATVLHMSQVLCERKPHLVAVVVKHSCPRLFGRGQIPSIRLSTAAALLRIHIYIHGGGQPCLLPCTSLPPQEARELWPTFSRHLPRQQVPFWRGPASHTHGKSSPPVFFRKKSKSREIALIPHRKHFFLAGRSDAAQRRKKMAFLLAFALISTKFSAVFSYGTAGSSCI